MPPVSADGIRAGMQGVPAPGRRWVTTIAGAFAAASLLAAACRSGGAAGGGASGGASPTPPSTPASSGVLCQDLAALRTSLGKLSPAKIKANGVATAPAVINDVQANLTTLIQDARGLWHAQTSTLKTALGQLQTAVKNVAASPSSSAATAALTALGQVTAATQQLLAAAGTRCSSAAASPGALPAPIA